MDEETREAIQNLIILAENTQDQQQIPDQELFDLQYKTLSKIQESPDLTFSILMATPHLSEIFSEITINQITQIFISLSKCNNINFDHEQSEQIFEFIGSIPELFSSKDGLQSNFYLRNNTISTFLAKIIANMVYNQILPMIENNNLCYRTLSI